MASTVKHTPGPWVNAGTMKDGRTYIDGAGSHKVPVAIAEWQEDADQQAANARLIAAAPDLLAALERVLPLIPGHTKLGCQGDCLACMAKKAARAAIAKATGGGDA